MISTLLYLLGGLGLFIVYLFFLDIRGTSRRDDDEDWFSLDYPPVDEDWFWLDYPLVDDYKFRGTYQGGGGQSHCGDDEGSQ